MRQNFRAVPEQEIQRHQRNRATGKRNKATA